MSVTDTNKIDGAGVSQDGKSLVLLITDHLPWDDEYTHLMILQDKINAYMGFMESGEWKKHYKGDFDYVTFHIAFKYDITKNCEKFLQVVQDQFGQYGVKIVAEIVE